MTAHILHLERRWNHRKNLEDEAIEGQFLFDINDDRLALSNVHDLSISGMGLMLPIEIPVGSVGILHYESDDFQLSIHGKVMWCEKPQALNNYDGQFRIGIEFDTGNHDDLVMYFMALRKYLDGFNQ